MASFEQDEKTKLWSVRFRIIEQGKEKNKRLRSFKTKKEATQAYVDFMSTYVPMDKIENDVGEMTIHEVFNLYIQKDVKYNLKGSTNYVILHDYNKHIAPYFSTKKLNEIKKRHIIDWQNSLTDQNYAYAYKKKIRSFLGSIFKFACQYLDYTENPVKDCPPFKKPQTEKEMQAWSLEEFNQFISVVDEPIFHAMFMTLYYMGIRKGEMQALTWDDIDLYAKKMSITKTLTRKTTKGSYEITPPKRPSSNREISIPDVLCEELAQYKALYANNYKFVFGETSPIEDKAIVRRIDRFTKVAKVKRITPHEFRHSHATLLIYLNASIAMISVRLGHKSYEETLRTYAHWLPVEEDKIIKLLNSTAQNVPNLYLP